MGAMRDPGHVAVGTWSGGRFMHFGEELSEERLTGLLRPGGGIDTVLTADTYGQGEADRLLGRALEGVPRDEVGVVGALGHDFYDGERDVPRGFPRFTDPRLRGPDQYASYLRGAAERSLERLGLDGFDLLLLHNPDRTGYTSDAVWDGMSALREAGLARMIGVAPGLAQRGHSIPDGVTGVAGAVGVVQQQEVESVQPEALQAALGRSPQVGRVLVGPAQARVGEAREAARPVALAVVEVVPERAHHAHLIAWHALQRAA